MGPLQIFSFGVRKTFANQLETVVDYDCYFQSFGLGLSYRHFKIALRTDQLDSNAAKVLSLQLVAAIPL